ncbi:MAG: sugar phosphate isomerase/epimerase [Lentisphaerae bacterium]|nr:sugar phosphate isomerase/epimerase [Lentisphaerota bacterium]
MTRPITLFTGQFADIPLKDLAPMAAEWGYDGLELACWGDHVDVTRAAKDKKYAKTRKEILAKHGLKVHAISNHLAGQLVCDPNDDARSDAFAPKSCRGNAEKKRKWAIQEMKNTAIAAKNIGVNVVNGFTGSPIWHMIYGFPPVSDDMVAAGFKRFAKLWNPILDVYDRCGVRFALEVHPTEIAFDILTAKRALATLKNRKTFGFNFDPSHLHWQMIDPVRFLKTFYNRIYHVHMKDAALTLDGETGILASHLNFGTVGRGWDFRSPGRGEVDFEEIIRTLNAINYKGPLSVEWEDAAMDREFGAAEACEFVRALDFPKSDRVFDEAFGK